MKGIVFILLLCTYTLSYSQVFTVDNCYIIGKQGIKTSPANFNNKAFNEFISKMLPPVEIIDQKIDGHVFVNLIVRNKTIAQTTLMYGISSLIDSSLVNYLKSARIEWIGSEILDTNQRVVIGIKVNYRNCTIKNILKTNLTQFFNNNEVNQIAIKQFKDYYNKYDAIYFFDSTNYDYYKRKIPQNKAQKIESDLQKLSWYKPEYIDKQFLFDYDNNSILNVILQANDSVYIVENNKLIFNEIGHLKFIKKKQKEFVIELETNCKSCNKINKTRWFYLQKQETINLLNSVTSYSNFPEILDSLSFKKTVITTSDNTYLRSSSFYLNDPYNKCTGYSSEEYNCLVLKTWGNIYGEINKGTVLNVIQEYTDYTKGKWFFVIANKTDGLSLGWISERDVKDYN